METVWFVNLRRDIYDLHGVYSLAGSLRERGIECVYVDASRSRDGAIKRISGGVAAYSAMESDMDGCFEFDIALKRAHPNVISVIGGAGPTFSPNRTINSTINAHCVGDGERSLTGFIKSNLGSFGNIHRHNEPPSDALPPVKLDELPFPDRSLVYREDSLLRNAGTKQFMAGRGCPYACSYCHNATHPSPPRKKSVDYLIEEIWRVKLDYGMSGVAFQDDLFIAPKPWLLEFSRKFPRLKLPFTCNVRANLMDDETAAILKQAGCVGVNWSIESGVERIRRDWLNRKMTDEQIIACADALHKYGIKFRIGNLIGLPSETPSDMLRTLELNIKCSPTLAVANIFTPYPGLPITKRATDEGWFEAGNPLPPTFCAWSALNFTETESKFIVRLMLLFSLLAKWPKLYFNGAMFERLMKLPVWLLRVMREAVYLRGMASIHAGASSLRQKARMAWRYFA